MKLIHKITVFPLINTLSLYLVLNLFFFEVLIRGQQLKEGGAYFNVTKTLFWEIFLFSLNSLFTTLDFLLKNNFSDIFYSDLVLV